MDDVYLKDEKPVSNTVSFVKGINALAVLLAIALLSLGIWLATRPGDCEKYATVPVFLAGAFFLLVAVLGLFGSWFAIIPILYTYLVLTFATLIGFLILTIFIFAVTSKGGGYAVAGQTFQEYKVSDYSNYVQDRLNRVSNWNHIKAVIAASDSCAKFDQISPVDYPYSNLDPIQSGCCRPPAECGYAMSGRGTFTTTSVPLSANPDCQRYSNDASIKCYDCDSCKGGVAQDLKKTGRVAGIITLVIFFALVAILVVACSVGHRFARENFHRV
ncbi:tetraspanin-10 [Physcomitrium patens]|uniref:Uncharacterized protein n=1 Tax=Physcomitrium patens TaxID=3218 RepID=A9RY93_PHYPA|nr:tetraspanin-10-like [Physcomitrium patens]XP_024383066.1 tetraspanin-10-like [Physcomitrium patens]XP_024383067.1 tetraspanin-10-like [Physcomitrium patens]PNR49225.1 hypothetical protein PHYPA_011121 [Physcomitrium patens]|eukprot:XP_024383065.1 tetraspanin-10-like [Physcomitrella patens]